jgi:hypothetical protein
MTFSFKTIARPKADQKRFMDRQSERLKQMGVHPAFSVSPDHIMVSAQQSYEDRKKPAVLYAEWNAVEKDDEIVVTRTEYGYLKNADGN